MAASLVERMHDSTAHDPEIASRSCILFAVTWRRRHEWLPAFSSPPSHAYTHGMAGNLAFTPIEQEIIVLRAVWDMIFGMVNYGIFEKGHGTVEAQVTFKSATHQRLFNILLVDFLSKPEKGSFGLPEADGPEKTDHTYLFYLRRICDEPKLNTDSDSLREPVEAFVDWLEDECFVEKVWLPSIEVEADLRLKRITFLKICGDIAKHNFPRLNWTVQSITKVLAESGVKVDEGQGFLVLPEFYEWFHDNILNYHGSTIAEHLNNIRWGIFHYLAPEFNRSFEKNDPKFLGCRFNQPAGCHDPLAKAMHWDLMNQVRTEPWFPLFTTAPHLKKRY